MSRGREDTMRQFEYHVETLSLADKWSSKKQAEELASLTAQLNQKGSQGWELMGLHSFDLVGGITGSSKGSITLTLWKRDLAQGVTGDHSLFQAVKQAAHEGLQQALDEHNQSQ